MSIYLLLVVNLGVFSSVIFYLTFLLLLSHWVDPYALKARVSPLNTAALMSHAFPCAGRSYGVSASVRIQPEQQRIRRIGHPET